MHYMKRGRSPADEPRLLPLDWKAGEFTVMIGRGRRCIHNGGNIRFRAMVKEELKAYSAGRKAKKSSIIKRILREINSRCDDDVGFVKQDVMTGRYYTATVTAAKVTIAQAFRDALHDVGGYKSSKQHKQLKRDIARGKVDAPMVCESCKAEVVNLQHDELEGEADSTQPVAGGASAIAVAAIPDTMPSAPKVAISGETSLEFWGDCIDPLVEFEHANDQENQTSNTNDLDTSKANNDLKPAAHYVCGCTSHDGQHCDAANDHPHWHPIDESESSAPPAPVMDPFEPIPLEDAMEMDIAPAAPEGRSTEWETTELPEEEKLKAYHQEENDASESSGSSHNNMLDSDDDDDDHAILVWASEFVTCPLCSLVQGRGDFDELPIKDIRKSLIG